MTDATKQLIERLRSAQPCSEAANALESAHAEIERLREAAKGSLVIVNTAQAARERAEARVAVTDEASIRADEREQCAQIAEWEGYATVGRQIAAAIRARGSK